MADQSLIARLIAIPIPPHPIPTPPPNFFGRIETPQEIEAYGANGGLVKLGNNIIWLAVIIGGLLALFNFIQAGYIYLTASGDSKAHEKVLSKFTMSLWGLAIMVLAPAIMAVFGFLFFKDATFFLNPQIISVLDLEP